MPNENIIAKIAENVRGALASLLARSNVSANHLTFLAFLFSLLAFLSLVSGELLLSGFMISVSALLDWMDGAVARQSGRASRLGAFLDSSLDRYADGFIFGGVLIFFVRNQGSLWDILWTLSSLWGAYEISYCRARAENMIKDCRVGFWERGERLVFLVLGIFFGNLRGVMCIMGIFTHVTVLARFLHARREILQSEMPSMPVRLSPRLLPLVEEFIFQPGGRKGRGYQLNLAVAITLFFITRYFLVR